MSNDVPRLSLPLLRTDPTQVPEEYTRLRAEQPVCPVSLVTGDPAYLATRHEDLKTVLADRRFSRAAVCGEYAPRSQAVRPNPDTIINMDPPRHTRIRQLAAQAFTARRVELLRPRIQQIVDELLDDMAAMTPPVDFNEVFARPLPLRIICDMLGVPFADHGRFTQWTECIMTISSTAEQIARAYVELRAYFIQLVADKRHNPGDDFLSALTLQSDAQGRLTESELVSLGTFLLVAGHETSVTVISSAVLNLMRHPDQLEALRADPTLWPGAVEEVSRLGIPGVSPFPRIATTDIKLGDVLIPEGSAVVVHYETALRDPEVYEDPERFDIHREQRSQVWFGHGPHFCLGAPVARAELEIGLRSLFDRFPTLAPAVPPESLRWKDYAALGNWEEFPVAWN
jgi:nocardicin N-oxygenase